MTAIDRLIDEVIYMRLQVQQLRAEVAALQDQVGASTGEAAALRIMLCAWPVQFPIPPLVVH